MTDGTRHGFRGYIASRPVNGVPYPHRVQNLVIRDYCQRKGLHFLLSATECAHANSFMMLNDVLTQLDGIAGIVLFSQFMLPADRTHRQAIYGRVLAAGAQLHAAMEEAVIAEANHIAAFDQVLTIHRHLVAAPFAGRYSGDVEAGPRAALTTSPD